MNINFYKFSISHVIFNVCIDVAGYLRVQIRNVLSLAILLLLSQIAVAEGGFITTRVGVLQKNFTGEKGISFAESKSGYGIEAAMLMDGSFFVPFVKSRFVNAQGSQIFLDSTTERTLTFGLYQVDFEVGAQLYIIPRRKSNTSVYFSVSGLGGFSYLNFAASQQMGNLAASDKSIGGGYAVGCGAEVFSSSGMSKWSIFAEAQYAAYTASLLGQKFDVGGLSLVLGVGW